MPRIEEFVASYLRWTRSQSDADQWSADYLWEIRASKPEEAWRLLSAAIEAAEEELLCAIGSGELEDFIVANGDAYYGRIAAAARRDRKFLDALTCVWAWDTPVRPLIDALLEELGARPR